MNKYLLITLLVICIKQSYAQIVTTEFGDIQGSVNGAVTQFLGIPFAKPPVNSLRWKAPETPTAWASVLATTSYAPVCPQKSFAQGSTAFTYQGNEDCLYLNVWTPQTGAGTRPVMVFIHGGGNQQGGASETGGGMQMYFGKNMAERGDAVIVTIQYRLGPLGFLVHPGLEPETTTNTSGNYAVLDQILALKWVQNNIANFGGDPSKVMIFGESAGGVDVGNLITSPLAVGLFQRACIQSASPVVGIYNTVKNAGITFVDSYTTTGTDVQKIAFMRTLVSDSVVKNNVSPLSGGVVGMNWSAVMDNYVFENYVVQNFQNGTFNKVPVMIGSNEDEMSLSVPPVVTPAMVTLLINAYIPLALQAQANVLYPPGATNAVAKKSYIDFLSDKQFTVNARRTAQCISQNQNEPVWRYFFTHKHTVAPLIPYGSYHGMELFYVFNTWENATLGTGPFFAAADDSVQNVMLDYWVNFAKTGNPNGAGLVTWPQYQSATDSYLEIKATPNGTQTGLRTIVSDFWDDVSNFVVCTISLTIKEADLMGEMIVFPNPTNGNISIAIDATQGDYITRVFDLMGNLVLENKNAATIHLANLANGVYTIKVQQNSSNWQTKLILASE